MIQEKDFLYRVPVKNALVTAPGKQVRNPEILVDLEGGEFMHGNILDANSTNKLIDQSVKDAINNGIENSNYVTKDLLEAETSARTKSDEDLNAKIKAERTRAEGKEKEISDKLAIIDGDSNTEGSFRKAINDMRGEDINLTKYDGTYSTYITSDSILVMAPMKNYIEITPYAVLGKNYSDIFTFKLSEGGVELLGGDDNHVLTSNATTIDITQYALKTELPTVPTNVSQLTNDSNFITQQDADAKYALANSLNTVNDSVSSLRVGLSKKQDKITVNSVDVTDIETADITRLRAIVRNLVEALNTSGLIRQQIQILNKARS